MRDPENERFYWVYDETVSAGTTSTIYNDETSTPSDDYLVFNSRNGTVYYEDDGNIVISFTAGKNISDNSAFGLQYSFERYYNNADPVYVKSNYYSNYTLGRMENIEEVYRIEELGDSSYEESFDVNKKSNNDIDNIVMTHTLACGFKSGIENQWSFDFVPKLSLQLQKFKNEQ